MRRNEYFCLRRGCTLLVLFFGLLVERVLHLQAVLVKTTKFHPEVKQFERELLA